MPRRGDMHRAFTIIVCQRCDDQRSASITRRLGHTVRRCPHGLLVTSACWSGESRCVSAVFSRGPRIALQPCDVDRTPNAPTIWLGPLTCDEDTRVVCEWIEAGDWAAALPATLRTDLGALRRSPLLN